jgi:VWFA-related protein
MMCLHRPAFSLLALGLLAFPGGAAAQQETFSETFDVRVINLEVVVEDAQGNRVHDLGIGDFELLIDGKSYPIDYFSEIRGNQAVAAAPQPEAPAGAASTMARAPEIGDDGRVSTSWVVFVDLALSDPRQIGHATDRLIEQMGHLPPGDRVAVFAFDGQRLENLADWGDRRERVLSGLRQLATLASSGLRELSRLQASDALRDRTTDVSDGLSNGRDFADPMFSAGSFEDSARNSARRLEASLVAAATTMRAASPPPGRRIFLNFAGAWPRDLAAYLGIPQNAPDNLANRMRVFYPARAYSGVYETANLLGYTIYSADLFVGRTTGASTETRDAEASRTALGVDFDRDFERDATLQRYAERTGGQAFTAGWAENSLATVQEDVSSFYWLGFSAKRKGDDKDHKVEVRVKKPGLKVRSRQQYKDLSRKAEVEQELESRLLFSRTRTQEDFTVLAGEPVVKRGQMVLPITFRIPLDKVVFLPKGKLFAPDLELRVGALDVRGERSEVPNIPIKMEGPRPQPGQYATYETELKLRTETRRLVLGLYDKIGDTLLISTIDLENPRR